MNIEFLIAGVCAVCAVGAGFWAVVERGRAARFELKARMAEEMAAANAETLKAQVAASAGDVAEALVARATETFQAQDRLSQAKLDERLKPVAETLAKFQEQVAAVEKARAEDTGGLKHQIAALAQATVATQEEARKLSAALRRGAGVQGRWGEQMLRNVLELAGLRIGVDFELQVHVESEGAIRRPDAVVRLPGDAVFVIDAKCSLNAYIDAQNATDESTREAEYLRHAMSVKGHMQSLATKAYWEQFEKAPDFVVMFVPGESMLAAAAERMPTLHTDAMGRSVIMTTPASLFALCRAVAYGWRNEQQNINAKEIASLGRELYKRMAVMGEHVTAMGRALASAVGRYNQFVGSLETQVLTQARRFEELSVQPQGAAIGELSALEASVRPLVKLEHAMESNDDAPALTLKRTAPTSAA